jgi:mannitol 2-dehydrogenase
MLEWVVYRAAMPAQGNLEPLELSPGTLAHVAARGLAVPRYDRHSLRQRIVHIGVGGFHRAHLAVYTHELAAEGSDWGIRGLGLLEADAAMASALGPQHGLYTAIERGDGEPAAEVIGSLVAYEHAADRTDEVVDRLAEPGVAIVSLTITESGYATPVAEGSTFDLIARGLDRRRRDGSPPVTILSCDNVQGNGDAARAATSSAADRLDPATASWIDENCSFPNSMVDRITPVTGDGDRQWLMQRYGVVDRWPVVCEPFRQWVVEDAFAAGRPPWENVGVIFSDDVHAWELYKLRLLNAAHSCMAYLCALAGLVHVDEAMAVPSVARYLDDLLRYEAAPSLRPIDGHPRLEYAATVLRRFANPGVRDQISRLCIDGTAKFPIFLVPTIEHHLVSGGPVERAALALAAWARYLGTVPAVQHAADSDAAAGEARRLAAEATAEPHRFLEFGRVFPPTLRDDDRFRTAFVAGYRAIADAGPLAAMDRVVGAGRVEPSGHDGD